MGRLIWGNNGEQVHQNTNSQKNSSYTQKDNEGDRSCPKQAQNFYQQTQNYQNPRVLQPSFESVGA
jgi:hypothetical protein